MADHGQLLAPEKTEIVILTKKRMNTILPLLVGDVAVEDKPAIKYLGLMIDRRLSLWSQIQQTTDKAAKGATSLSRLMANVTGPKASKRRLLMTAEQAVLLYGAESLSRSSRRNERRCTGEKCISERRQRGKKIENIRSESGRHRGRKTQEDAGRRY